MALIKKPLFVLTLLLLLSLVIKSYHFPSRLNFSTDQAIFSTHALEIWREHKIQLIGPSISFHYQGRDVYQGSITYYMQLLFLLAGNFDPLISSYLFTLFAACMVLPLYYGVSLLLGKRVALLMSIVYLFLPYYVNYTTFFWNPNFQFSLMPLVILCMGLLEKRKKSLYVFALGLLLGILLLFHYQFIIVIVCFALYYFLYKKRALTDLGFFATGIVCGFSPIIFFEFRNNFYNARTLLLYIAHFQEVFGDSSTMSLPHHYFLSISFFVLLALVSFMKKHITYVRIGLLFLLLFVVDIFIYSPTPTHGYGMVAHWNYTYEKKVHDIIRKERLKNFNVINQGYDTLAHVQKYLLKKDEIVIDYDNYRDNAHLFVITNKEDYLQDPAYEIATFTPSRLLKKWKINDYFFLYELVRKERTNSS